MATEEFEFPDEKAQAAAEAAASAPAKKAPNDTDFEIETIDDTPPKDQGRRPLDREVTDPSEDELNEYSDKVQTRIKELTHARHDERRAKEALAREKSELERFAQQMLDENKKLRGFVDDGSKQYIEQAQTLAEREVAQAKNELRAAQEAFDSEAIIEAQDKLMDAKIKLREAKNFRPTTLQTEKSEVQQQKSVPAEPEVDTKTLNWQQENQWFGRRGNEEHTSFALGVHQKLVNSGADPTSDAYFEQINARMRSTFPELFNERGEPEKTQSRGSQKPPAAVVAPAARSSGVKKIRLTTTQIALAAKFGLTPQQYAAQVAKLENQNG